MFSAETAENSSAGETQDVNLEQIFGDQFEK